MAETLRTHDPGPRTAWLGRRRSSFEPVADEPASPTGAHRPVLEEPNIGRSAVIGALVGFVVVTIVVTLAGTLGGIGLGSSFGLGAFVGTWGGAGFGFMMGGTLPLARHYERL